MVEELKKKLNEKNIRSWIDGKDENNKDWIE